MTALLVVETFLLVLLSLLVAGLLRSHAEILRRLDSAQDHGSSQAGGTPSEPGSHLADGLAEPRSTATPAYDITGTTLGGEPVKLAVRGGKTSTLIAFLSSGCLTCRAFWDAFQPGVRPTLPGDARLVIVTKDSNMESPSKLRELAPPDVPMAMSTEAWDAYGVPMSPYFIYVDGASGTVHGEGSATGWQQVVSLLRDALADEEMRASSRQNGAGSRFGDADPAARPGSTGQERFDRIERDLRAAGIGAGHPSLYEDDLNDGAASHEEGWREA